MQKSFFNKSITRIAMLLGAVGVFTMAPMHNALAGPYTVYAIEPDEASIITTLFTKAEIQCLKKRKIYGGIDFLGTYKVSRINSGKYKGQLQGRVDAICVDKSQLLYWPG